MFGEKREKSLRAEVPGGPWGGCGEESEVLQIGADGAREPPLQGFVLPAKLHDLLLERLHVADGDRFPLVLSLLRPGHHHCIDAKIRKSPKSIGCR